MLVNCPNCGKKVSDISTISCPDCGFDVRSWAIEQEALNNPKKTIDPKMKYHGTVEPIDSGIWCPECKCYVSLGKECPKCGHVFYYTRSEKKEIKAEKRAEKIQEKREKRARRNDTLQTLFLFDIMLHTRRKKF